MLSKAWNYRYFIYTSVRTDFKTKFVKSKLGATWLILNPLSQVVIFAFILSAVMSAKLPGISNKYAYALYLMSGMLCWALFSEIITRSLNVFLDNSNIIKKLVFPKITLPIIILCSALINNIFFFAAVAVIFLSLGHSFGVNLFFLPIITLVTAGFALGMGLGLGVINVFLRDIGQVVPVLMQFAYWFTPIVYTINIIPENYRFWLSINPLTPIVASYHNVLLYNRPPDWQALSYSIAFASALLSLSFILYRKASPEMVDML